MNLKKMFKMFGLVAAFTSLSMVALAETRYSDVTKLAKYLYEITYVDYDYEEYASLSPVSRARMDFGCTSVRNGRFYGRNFDFLYNETPEYVIHVQAKDGRFASVGVAYPFTARFYEDMGREEYTALPWSTIDGINENGVGINVNICPVRDLTLHISSGGTHPENTKYPSLNISAVVRYVLDNAKSAKHAIKLLQERNIVNDVADHEDFSRNGYGLHFMINDYKDCFIVEWRDDKIYYTKDDRIMTNFFNTLDEYTPHASGIERYDIMQEYYDMGRSMDGMTELMKKAMYSYAYDSRTNPPRFSDLGLGYNHKFRLDITNEVVASNAKVRQYLIDYVTNARVRRNEPNIWHTVSTSIYDLQNLILRLYVQEDYSRCYEFSIR